MADLHTTGHLLKIVGRRGYQWTKVSLYPRTRTLTLNLVLSIPRLMFNPFTRLKRRAILARAPAASVKQVRGKTDSKVLSYVGRTLINYNAKHEAHGQNPRPFITIKVQVTIIRTLNSIRLIQSPPQKLQVRRGILHFYQCTLHIITLNRHTLPKSSHNRTTNARSLITSQTR